MSEPHVLSEAVLKALPPGKFLRWGYAYDPGDNKHWAVAWEYLRADKAGLRIHRTWYRVDTGESLQEVNP